MNLDELAKAIIGAEENAPRFGDILQPGQSVALRVSGIQGVPGDKGDKGDKGDPGQDGRDSTVPGARGIPGQDGADSTVPGPRGIPGKDGADSTVPGPKGERGDRGEKGDKGEKGDPGRSSGWRSLGGGGGGTSGTGLPPGGLPGQVVTNTAPGTGDWRDLPPAGAALTVTDGTTSVANVTQETIFGATVAAGGAGEAIVTVAAGSTPFIGTTPDAPIPLAPCDYVLAAMVETIPSYVYDNGPLNDGVGATITEWATGSIATTTLDGNGADYAPGDTFTVDGGDGLAAGVVDTVDVGGEVIGYHLTAAGDAYAPQHGVNTTSSGIGNGLQLGILGITPTATGPVLAADNSNPATGQRIVFYGSGVDKFFHAGIYEVTDPGDGAAIPWVLTRTTDCDTLAKRCRFWTVRMSIYGDVFAAADVRVTEFSGLDITLAFAVGGVAYSGAAALGHQSVASGLGSIAAGARAIAMGQNVTASGDHSFATGIDATASGYASFVAGDAGTASGEDSLASGAGAIAYGHGQRALAGGDGLGQLSDQTYGAQTPDDTPTALHDGAGNPFSFKQIDAVTPDFTKTAVVRGRIVARRTDTPGTASAWDFSALIDGDGVSAYRWVGGSDPVPAIIAQDAAASTWAVAVTISGASIVVTVTGEDAVTIDWMTTIELDEVV